MWSVPSYALKRRLRNLSALDAAAKEFRLNVMAAERTYGRLLMKKEDGRERRETERGDVGQETKVCTQNFKLSLSNLGYIVSIKMQGKEKSFSSKNVQFGAILGEAGRRIRAASNFSECAPWHATQTVHWSIMPRAFNF